jgi:hypothetical protein
VTCPLRLLLHHHQNNLKKHHPSPLSSHASPPSIASKSNGVLHHTPSKGTSPSLLLLSNVSLLNPPPHPPRPPRHPPICSPHSSPTKTEPPPSLANGTTTLLRPSVTRSPPSCCCCCSTGLHPTSQTNPSRIRMMPPTTAHCRQTPPPPVRSVQGPDRPRPQTQTQTRPGAREGRTAAPQRESQPMCKGLGGTRSFVRLSVSLSASLFSSRSTDESTLSSTSQVRGHLPSTSLIPCRRVPSGVLFHRLISSLAQRPLGSGSTGPRCLSVPGCPRLLLSSSPSSSPPSASEPASNAYLAVHPLPLRQHRLRPPIPAVHEIASPVQSSMSMHETN